MKQYRSIAFLVFMVVMISPLFSQEEAKDVDTIGLEVRAGLVGAASLSSSYIVPEIAVLYKPNVFGIGLGVRNYFGLSFNDAYLTPYIAGEMGWFGLKVGTAIRVKDPDSGVEVNSDAPFFLAADFYPTIKVGPGRLFFGGGMSVFPSTTAEVESDSIIGTIVGTTMVAVMSLIKVEVGAGYRLIL
jgi:hypothetical protein